MNRSPPERDRNPQRQWGRGVDRGLRVLLLEDDAADAELEARALTAAGFDVTCDRVDSEAAFIACLDAVTYDVILSDYRLPSFNGLRALETLRQRGLDVPFILVSGALGEEKAIECLKLGATDYVLKGRLERLAPVVLRALRDAEERRQRIYVETALRQSEERYRSVVENAQEIIATLAPDGTITSANSAFAVVLGWPRAALIGKPFAPLLHHDDRAAADTAFARALRGEPMPSFELRLRTAAGEDLVHEMTATAQRFGDEPARILVVARDVTARKRAEMKMETLVEMAKDLTGPFDFGDVLVRVQERTARAVPCDVVATFCDSALRLDRMVAQYGIAPDLIAAAQELTFPPGEPFAGIVGRGETIRVDDSNTDESPYAELFRRFRLRSALVIPLRSHDRHFGGVVFANYAPRPFDREQLDMCEAITRQVAGAVEAADLQRVQRDEAEVASALVRVGQELISSVDQPILLERLCRVTTEVLGCDVSYTLMLKEDQQSFLPVASFGESAERRELLSAMRVPRDAFESLLEQTERDGIVHYEAARHAHFVPEALRGAYVLTGALAVRLRRRDELIGVHVAGYRSGPGTFTHLQRRIARGTAQLASLALENARLVQKLEGANRLKADFLATISHELRTPLNVIIGYNELLQDGAFGPVTPDMTLSLERVGTSARELLELIGATLDVSRLETGRAALNLQDIDAVALLKEIEAETRTLHEKPGVESIWQIAPDLPHLYSDVVKLKVLLKNLITNAVKFTDRGSVSVSATVREGSIEFTVVDTGIGMSPETQAVIFEPFRQGDSSTTRRHGGVGLGLYIVSRLLELLSGSIEVESTPGVGSTFRIAIPIDALRYARQVART